MDLNRTCSCLQYTIKLFFFFPKAQGGRSCKACICTKKSSLEPRRKHLDLNAAWTSRFQSSYCQLFIFMLILSFLKKKNYIRSQKLIALSIFVAGNCFLCDGGSKWFASSNCQKLSRTSEILKIFSVTNACLIFRPEKKIGNVDC